jgi:hypothetical protein
MDELEKAAIESAAKALLAPVTGTLANVIGILGGDQLEEYRAEKRERRRTAKEEMVIATRAIVDLRKVTPDPNSPREKLEEILEAAQDNSIPELRDLYARLAAAAVDPARQRYYRSEFAGFVKQMEPIDASVLALLLTPSPGSGARNNQIAQALGMSTDEVDVSFVNLRKIGVAGCHPGMEPNTFLTAAGRVFLMCVQD